MEVTIRGDILVKAVKTGLNSNTTTNNKNNNKTSTSTCAPNNTQSKKIETYEIPKSTPSYTNTCASSNTYSNPVTYTANTSSGSITAISSNVDSYSRQVYQKHHIQIHVHQAIHIQTK